MYKKIYCELEKCKWNTGVTCTLEVVHLVAVPDILNPIHLSCEQYEALILELKKDSV